MRHGREGLLAWVGARSVKRLCFFRAGYVERKETQRCFCLAIGGGNGLSPGVRVQPSAT